MHLALDMPTEVGRADLAIGRVAVVNDGDDPAVVSQRFHLYEGDLVAFVDGEVHLGAEQIDSQARTVDVPPGMAIGSGVLLVASDRGLIFDPPGVRRMSVGVRTVTTGDLHSNSTTVAVGDGEPLLEPTEALAAAGCQVEEGALGRLVEAPAAVRVMMAASAIRAGGWDSMSLESARAVLRFELEHISADELGWLVTGLLPPAHLPDDPLLVVAREAAPRGSLAAALVGGEPFDADRW